MDRAVAGRIRGTAAEPDLAAASRGDTGDRQLEMLGQCAIAAQQLAAVVEDRDRIADRVEGPLPLALRLTNGVMQLRVLDRDDDLGGNQPQQLLIRHGNRRGRIEPIDSVPSSSSPASIGTLSALRIGSAGRVAADKLGEVLDDHRARGWRSPVARPRHAGQMRVPAVCTAAARPRRIP